MVNVTGGNLLGINKFNVLINVLIISVIIILLYYYFPKLCNWVYPEDEDGNNAEQYAPNRERTDPQSDWNIIEEAKKIRIRQKENLNKLSQDKGYGI